MSLLVQNIPELREYIQNARQSGKSIGFVPTMGALHAGHAALIQQAREANDRVIVSIFVNPLQFDRKDDFDRYPIVLEQDYVACRCLQVDVVFAPKTTEMYPSPQLTYVEVSELTKYLCGAFRPGHFRGVATVVLKLLNIVQPDTAYFGEKDAQQLAVIQRMVQDLNLPVTIVPVPTVREEDGLALSSRNKHLNPIERSVAPILYRALSRAADLIRSGEHCIAKVKEEALQILKEDSSLVRVEYLEFVDRQTLTPVEIANGNLLIAGAIWIGSTRLIDNIMI